MTYHFTLKQIFLGIIGFLFTGPIGMFRNILMADPEYAESNRKYKNAVIRLQQLQSAYAKEHPNSAIAIAREQDKRENGMFYRTTQTIMRGKK